jgi:hypothetical protein
VRREDLQLRILSQLPSSLLPVFAGIIANCIFAAAVYSVLYGSQAGLWPGALFRFSFSVAFLIHNLASLVISSLVARSVGASVNLAAGVTLLFLAVIALPTLWVLAYYNNCLGLPGPFPFGGPGGACG